MGIKWFVILNHYKNKSPTHNATTKLMCFIFFITIATEPCEKQMYVFRFTGYDWQTGKLDPSFMNLRKGEESMLPHLVQV